MQQQQFFSKGPLAGPIRTPSKSASRKTVIGLILIVALLAFEIFNFDTTRFALQNLLGDVAFMGVTWATILAIAFCSIDFAGLARLFTPERGKNEPKAVWYLMGAWLLGAAMNAIMTWWAISITLLSHDFGNEVLGREQLLTFVPIFVAGLVLLTRVLFIGAFGVAGEHIFDLAGNSDSVPAPSRPAAIQPGQSNPGMRPVPPEAPGPAPSTTRSRPSMPSNSRPAPMPMAAKPRR